MNKFSIGQLVTSVMYPGTFVVSAIGSWQCRDHTFYRYTIRCGEEYHGDNPEVWLSPARIKHPQLTLIKNEPVFDDEEMEEVC